MKSLLALVLVFLLGGVLWWGFNERIASSEHTVTVLPVTTKPVPVPDLTPKQTSNPSTPNNATTTPVVQTAVDYVVPFTAQAPTGNWDAFHEEACEEASALMVWHYFYKTTITSTDQVEQELTDAASWERQNVGTDVSIPAKDAVQMLQAHFKLNAHTITASEQNLKQELSAGNLIIVPAQGQFLHNPNFKQPGPRYHMLVLRGYDSTHFITNDPGTRRGEKYVYTDSVLLDAVHDWNGGAVEDGAKVAIVVTGLLK